MAIRIERSDAGNCLFFHNSSSPFFFNTCLSGEVDANDSELVNVVNDIATAGGDTVYEFYNIHYTEFVDSESSSFADAQAVVDYINLNGNVVEVTNVAASYRGVWDADTNNPDLSVDTPANGDWFYIDVSGDIDPNTGLSGAITYQVNDVVKYNEDLTTWQHVPNETIRVDNLEQEVSDIVYSTESPLFNTNPDVYADGAQASADPNNTEAGWYYKNTDQSPNKINWYYVGNMNPENKMTLGTLKSQYAVIDVIAAGVPYFSVYTQPTGSNDAAIWYKSRINYLTIGALDAYVGQQVLIYWGEDPSNKFVTIPHIELTNDESTSNGLQATDENILFAAISTSTGYPEGSYEFIAKTLGYKNNNHIREYLLDTNDPVNVVETTDVSSSTVINFTADATNTSIILGHNGTHYGVNTIRAELESDGTISIKGAGSSGADHVTNINYENVQVAGSSAGTTPQGVVNALNALFTVNPLGAGSGAVTVVPTLDGADITYNVAEGQTPVTGDPVHLYTTGTDLSSGHGARLWSNETIDEAGEYFDVKITGEGRFILGLVDTNDATAMAALANDSGNGHSGLLWGNAFYDYGSYIAPWTLYGSNSSAYATGPGWSGSTTSMMRYNTNVQTNFENMAANLFRVGINSNGYIYVSYYDAGRLNDFIVTARRTVVTSASNYALVVKLWSGNATLVEVPEISYVNENDEVLAYRYIESPDGQFHYPLFATEAEAISLDSDNGGSGEATGNVYVDEPTFSTWYSPITGFTTGSSSEPINSGDVIYTEIPTNADSLYAPSQFTDTTITVNEGDALNIQLQPQDTNYVTTVSNNPLGTMLFAGAITGTAPQVDNDNVTNPSDTYTISVVRTNAYGSSTGTLTLVVNNLTAPATTITGTSVVSGDPSDNGDGTVDMDTLDVIGLDDTLESGKRFVITQSWVETNVLPHLGVDGDKVYVGVPKVGADWSDISPADDFEAVIRWTRSSSSVHQSTIHADGSSDSINVQSLTDSFYDYAIEIDNSNDLHVIACNVNDINTQPAIVDGGQFARTITHSNYQGSVPANLVIAIKGSSTHTVSLTGLNEISIPAAPAPTNQTSWSKALDFSGSSERAQMVNTSSVYNPMMMADKSVTVSSPTDSNARPWAAACVFKIDGHSSNQHIWNLGEGAGSADDNIYLRVDSFGALYFGWGRQDALNEHLIATNLGTASWYGCYIGHSGVRFSGADATSANLSSHFQIKLMFYQNGDWDFNPNPNGAGAGVWTTTGGRMDRQFGGQFNVGGRGSNRNFHGKVASMVVTTLKQEAAPFPSNEEIKVMVTDPIRWVRDYKEGETFRQSYNSGNTTWDTASASQKTAGTQIWLMGDGTSDAYAKIRNQVSATDQNYTPLNMISMVSSDIQNVDIPGLT